MLVLNLVLKTEQRILMETKIEIPRYIHDRNAEKLYLSLIENYKEEAISCHKKFYKKSYKILVNSNMMEQKAMELAIEMAYIHVGMIDMGFMEGEIREVSSAIVRKDSLKDADEIEATIRSVYKMLS